jgi:C-terminal processing protease CtpA/Prc
MGHSLRVHARKRAYEGISGGQALADRLTADLREVGHDKHLWVGYQPGGARDEPADGPTKAELDQWRDAVARDNFAFDKAERMPGNIGYLKFRIFAYTYLAAETASAAMTFVAHTDALIIDLRDNMGGDPAMVAFLLSYLFDSPTHLNDIQFRAGNELRQYWTLPHVPGKVFGGVKPVYVLTSPVTFSAAEDFAYVLKNTRRAQIVGEASGGGAHPSRAFKISKHFVISIPYARSVSPITGGNWEGTGVTPDIPVSADRALAAAYAAALDKLAAQATDEGRKKELRDLHEKSATP